MSAGGGGGGIFGSSNGMAASVVKKKWSGIIGKKIFTSDKKWCFYKLGYLRLGEGTAIFSPFLILPYLVSIYRF